MTDNLKSCREGSKRQIAIEVMRANAEKPMAEVIALIASANGVSLSRGRSYYVKMVKRGWAPGVVEASVRAEKAPKPEKAPKEKTVKRMVAEVVAKTTAPKTPKTEKTPEEIERIKAANLARLKQVHAKRKQNVKREEPEVLEVDPFAAPIALTRDEVTALV